MIVKSKVIRRWLAGFLCFVMMVGILPSTISHAAGDTEDNSIWTDDGAYDAGLYASDEGDWVINDGADLAALAKKVNNGSSFSGYTITLGRDIDLSGKVWAPIGSNAAKFAGMFDGQGHTISGMMITGDLPQYTGLFGFVSADGMVKDLAVQGSIDGATTASNSYIGGFAGYEQGGLLRYHKRCVCYCGSQFQRQRLYWRCIRLSWLERR